MYIQTFVIQESTPDRVMRRGLASAWRGFIHQLDVHYPAYYTVVYVVNPLKAQILISL